MEELEKKLTEQVARMHSILSNPQPGIMSWLLARNVSLGELQDTIKQLLAADAPAEISADDEDLKRWSTINRIFVAWQARPDMALANFLNAAVCNCADSEFAQFYCTPDEDLAQCAEKYSVRQESEASVKTPLSDATSVQEACGCGPCGSAENYQAQVCMPLDGKVRGIDKCLHQIVAALNAGGVRTVACCCGHGKMAGNIALEDGRQLMVLTSPEAREAFYKQEKRKEFNELAEKVGELPSLLLGDYPVKETRQAAADGERIAYLLMMAGYDLDNIASRLDVLDSKLDCSTEVKCCQCGRVKTDDVEQWCALAIDGKLHFKCSNCVVVHNGKESSDETD